MSKVIDWASTYNNRVGNHTSFRLKFERVQEQIKEMQVRQEKFQKALPFLEKQFLNRLLSKQAIRVTRALPYTAVVMQSEDEEDDGFYKVRKSENFSSQFVEKVKTIPVGTNLTFVQFEKSMGQLWFKTDSGEEVGIYLNDKQNLMTHTDIYDVVIESLE